mgnify:CR=1 FL=1
MTVHERLISATTNAIDVFTELYDQAVVSGGPKFTADGCSALIDCAISKNRIMVVTLDHQPDEFMIALGNKNGADADIVHEILPADQLNASTLLKYMEDHFAKKPLLT